MKSHFCSIIKNSTFLATIYGIFQAQNMPKRGRLGVCRAPHWEPLQRLPGPLVAGEGGTPPPITLLPRRIRCLELSAWTNHSFSFWKVGNKTSGYVSQRSSVLVKSRLWTYVLLNRWAGMDSVDKTLLPCVYWLKVLSEDIVMRLFSRSWVVREYGLRMLSRDAVTMLLLGVGEGRSGVQVSAERQHNTHLVLECCFSVLSHMIADRVYRVFVATLVRAHLCSQIVSVTNRDVRKINALHHWCFQKPLGIKWYRNNEVRWTTGQPHLSAIVQHSVSPCLAILHECQTKQMPRS